jgi:hypothetical protein
LGRSSRAPIFYISLFLALAHEAISANAPPELFDRMAYDSISAQLTTNVYFQHTLQMLTLPRRRFAFSGVNCKFVPVGTREV